MQPEHVVRRVEELEVAAGEVARRISDLVDRAAAVASEEGLADRPDAFRGLYVDVGERELLPRIDGILAALAELDPGRKLEQSWICVLECKANYYLSLVASVKAYRDRLSALLRRPATPFAPADAADAARHALAVCEEMAALPEYGWIAQRKLGQVRWLLEDRTGAIAALEAYVERSGNPERRLHAAGLLDVIRTFEAPPRARA
jgi:hypothetical protein